MICPRCGSPEVCPSKTFKWTDVLYLVRGREAVRCQRCRMRFFAAEFSTAALQPAGVPRGTRRPARPLSPPSKKQLVRQLTVISIFALAAIIFLLFLRYLTTE